MLYFWFEFIHVIASSDIVSCYSFIRCFLQEDTNFSNRDLSFSPRRASLPTPRLFCPHLKDALSSHSGNLVPDFHTFSSFLICFENVWIGELRRTAESVPVLGVCAGTVPGAKHRQGDWGGSHSFKASFKVNGIFHPASTNFHSFRLSRANLVWFKAKYSHQIFFCGGV